MYSLLDLFRLSRELQTEIDGEFMPCRPMPAFFMWRLHDAWKVLKGEADAVIWPGGQ